MWERGPSPPKRSSGAERHSRRACAQIRLNARGVVLDLKGGKLFYHILRITLPAIVLAGVALAADITGTWDFQVKTPQRNGTPVFVFKQEGEKLSGTYSGQLGKTDLTGTVKGDQVEFSFGNP